MVLLMGSKEEDVPSEPAVKPVFMEDMNESELATAVCTSLITYVLYVNSRAPRILFLSDFVCLGSVELVCRTHQVFRFSPL